MKKKPVDPLLVPSDVPRSDYNRKTGFARIIRAWFIVATVVCPLLLVIMGAIVVDTLGKLSDTGSSVSSANESNGQGMARILVQDWVRSAGANLVDPQIVAWVGQTQQTSVAPPAGTAIFEHTFTVNTSNLGIINVSVRVAEDTTTHAFTPLSSPPYISRNPAATVTSVDSVDWSGFTATSTTPAMEGAVKTWATAYIGGDADALKAVIRDGDANHVYAPFDGATLTNVAISRVAITTGTTPDDADSAIASVTITATLDTTKTSSSAAGEPADTEDTPASTDTASPTTSASTTSPASTSPSPAPTTASAAPSPAPAPSATGDAKPITISYDILINDLKSGAPAVAAWGAPGDGPTLKQFQNATIKESK